MSHMSSISISELIDHVESLAHENMRTDALIATAEYFQLY